MKPSLPSLCSLPATAMSRHKPSEAIQTSHCELDAMFRRHHDQLLLQLEERFARHCAEVKEAVGSSSCCRTSPRTPDVPRSRPRTPDWTRSRPRTPDRGCSLQFPLPPAAAASPLRLSGDGGTVSRSGTPTRVMQVRPKCIPQPVRPPSLSQHAPVQLFTESVEGETDECDLPHEVKEERTPEPSEEELIAWDVPECLGGEVLKQNLTPVTGDLTPRVSRLNPRISSKDRSSSKERSNFGVHHRKHKDMWRLKIRKKVLTRRAPGPGKICKPADLLTAYTKKAHVSKHSRLAGFILREEFDLLSSVFIIINCLFIALQLEFVTDQAEKTGVEVLPSWALPIEIVFCLVFSGEFGLRMWVHGRNFFHSKDWAWTVFDGLVVGFSSLEVAYEWMSSGNTTFIRAMRTLRMTRAIRVVRVFRFFRELRMFVCSILGSFKALIWSAVMMLLFWYVCGVVLTQATYEDCSIGIQPTHQNCAPLKQRFGTLRRSVLSLYMSMSGGVDWDEIYKIMDPISEIYAYLFLVYLFFTMFGVLNIVTGIFVEAAKESAQNDRDMLVRSQLRHQDKYINDMIRLFQEIDTNGSGLISREEFQRHLNDERALAYFETLKLDISDVATLFDLIDVDKSGGIDIEEFLTGCQRLKGESRALDLAVMRTEILGWMGHFWQFAEHVEERLGEIAEQLGDVWPVSKQTPSEASKR